MKDATTIPGRGGDILTAFVFVNVGAQEVPKSGNTASKHSLKPIDSRTYNYFLFERMDRKSGKQIWTLVLAKVTPAGFQTRDVSASPCQVLLCAAGGKVYSITSQRLVSVDISSGRCNTLDDDVQSWIFREGKLYTVGAATRVYDFQRQAYRVVTAEGFRPSRFISVSPDGKRIASFAKLDRNLQTPLLANARKLQIKTQRLRVCKIKSCDLLSQPHIFLGNISIFRGLYFSVGTTIPRIIMPWQKRKIRNVGTAAITSDA